MHANDLPPPVAEQPPALPPGNPGTDSGDSDRLRDKISLRRPLPLALVLAVLMWGWFVIELILFPVFIAPPGSGVWESVFVLDSLHPEYLWTWVTSIFSHGSVPHLLVNTFVLINVGVLVEILYSRRDFMWIFFGTAVFASATQLGRVLMVDPSISFSMVGASGGVAGLIGAIAVRKPRMTFFLVIIPMPAVVLLGVVVGGSLAITYLHGPGAYGIAHTAHAGGMVGGAAYGLWYAYQNPDEDATLPG